jgi:hypothetical protein
MVSFLKYKNSKYLQADFISSYCLEIKLIKQLAEELVEWKV